MFGFLLKEWKKCLYATDCSEIGVVQIRDSGKLNTYEKIEHILREVY